MNKQAMNKQAILAIDFQEEIIDGIEHGESVMQSAQKLLFAAQELSIPILGVEQSPDLIGSTCEEWKDELTHGLYARSAFSALKNSDIAQKIKELEVQEWILVGFETHISLYQTARDLLQQGKKVTIVNDATASRSLYDYSTALAALRHLGANIMSVEMLIFDWLADIENPLMSTILSLMSTQDEESSSSCCSGGSCCK